MKENIREAIEFVKAKLMKAKKEKFVFLLIGQTGRGKSSTINSLMGEEIAPTNAYKPQTMEVETYQSSAYGVKFDVIDTPGLCDELDEESKDQEYLDKIKNNISSFDCLWFVSRLDDTRVSRDEKRALKLVSEAFGNKIWEHAVIVFTFADKVSEDKFDEAYTIRTELIQAEIMKYVTDKVAKTIPSVAVTNESDFLPNGQEWLGELYTQTFMRMSDKGTLSFLIATADRVNVEGKVRPTFLPAKKNEEKSETTSDASPNESKPQINLTQNQVKQVEKKIDAVLIGGLALTGASIGAAFGPVGAAIGGAVGAAIGLWAWFRD